MTIADDAHQSITASSGQVFVAHSTTNVEDARSLCQMLHEHGVTTWMAPDDVRGSRSWPEQILDAIERSAVVVVLVSAASNAPPIR